MLSYGEFEMYELPPELPDHLKQAAISLKDELGVSEYAWKYHDAVKVVVNLAENGYLITRGGAISLPPKLIYKGWHYSKIDDIDQAANIRASYLKASRFLEDSFDKVGDKYLYVIYFEKP